MFMHRVAREFFNRPLLLQPAAAEVISRVLLSKIGAGPGGMQGEDDAGETRQYFGRSALPDGSVEFHSPRSSRFYGDYPIDPDSNGRPKPYRRTADGTAIITMVGEFVNRGAYVGASSGLISYEGFKYQMQVAGSDERVNRIIMDMESPGGAAIGCFEAAALVRRVAEAKPVVAVANGMMCSAAYGIASGASQIVTMPTALVGSVGVVMVHLDFEKYLEMEGVKPTLIFSGDHKVDGNPYQALPEDVREDFQRESNSFYNDFVSAVAAGRTGLTEKQIKDTEARVFKGKEAVDAGLADDVGTFEDLLAEFQRSPAKGGTTSKGKMTMKTFTEDEHNQALAAARSEGKAEGVTEGTAAGAKAANERVSAILANDKIKGREAAALDLAMKSPDMSVDAVVAFVEKNVAAGSGKASVSERMGGQGSVLSLGPASDQPSRAQQNGWGKATSAVNRARGFTD